jgi:hypothetical protein
MFARILRFFSYPGEHCGAEGDFGEIGGSAASEFME